MLDAFLNTFAKIPQRIIWKWEPNVPQDFPPNVLPVDWIPQQDLLGHPNARLMISAGGLCTVQEAIYHGVPILGLPFHEEQRFNLARPRKEGHALMLHWLTATEEDLHQAIVEILNNPRYESKACSITLNILTMAFYDSSFRANATRASQLMKDEILPGEQVAAYWIEHVLRHGNTKHLELSSKKMPFHQRYLLDVVAFLVAVVFFGITLVVLAIRRLLSLLTRSSPKLKSQ